MEEGGTMKLGEKVRHLRKLSGMSQQEVAEKLGVSKEYVSLLETNKRTPSLEILSRLSAVFRRNVSYFLDEREISFSAVFRASDLTKKEKENLNKALGMIENYVFLEDIMSNRPPLAPTYPKPSKDELRSYSTMFRFSENMANGERKRLGLGSEPIKDIFSTIEDEGLHIIWEPLGSNGLDGVFLFNEGKGAFCILNTARTGGRQKFSAAHEYCHYLKDRDAGYKIDRFISNEIGNRRNRSERIADLFASAFLMPAERIKSTLDILERKHLTPMDVIVLKRHFGVSYQAMVYRLLNLHHIKEKELDEFLNVKPMHLETELFGDRDEEIEKERKGLPTRYLRLAFQAYMETKISLDRLAEIVGLNRFILEDMLEDIRIKRQERRRTAGNSR
jgi:Zn-dependent peptidase ImmA (M78 family)/transcriptional regulator with XRE-family HTH domain